MPSFPQPPFTPPPLASAADAAVCRAAIRAGSRSFHMAARVLPRRLADHAVALYAFCRRVDDLVDGSGARVSPRALRERLDRAYAGAPVDDPVDRAFADMVARTALPQGLPAALIEGLGWDLEGRRFRTLADTRAYAARVAGAVGAMMAWLMGARAPQVIARAIDLGLAMQFTNIARDVGEDARAGRVYLPADWLKAEGLSPEELLCAPVFRPALGRVVLRLLAEADRLYARAEAGIAELPRRYRMGIRAARLIYAGIGDEIRRAGGDSVSARAHVGTAAKLGLMTAAALSRARVRAGDLAAPPEPEAAYLVEIVRAAPAPAAFRPVSDRLLWVAHLFHDLERRARTPERAA